MELVFDEHIYRIARNHRHYPAVPLMLATRALLILLLILYFWVPALVSALIFDNEFYIYSNSQENANILSYIYGAIFISWSYLLFRPTKGFLSNRAAAKLTNWKGLPIAYFTMLTYGLALLVQGQRIRGTGATREELLDGMDDFLLPGMGLLLLLTSVYCVARATRLQFYGMFLIFLLIDITYNGKIFSFLALILFFMRLDYFRPPTNLIIKAFLFWGLLGLSMLLFSGLMRLSLAGDDLSTDMIGVAYLFGSEFLGVQASIGWAMEYFAEGYPMSFWAFGATLQDFYKSSVGHGLATSPGAFFEANFGNAGPFLAIFGSAITLMLFQISVRVLGWIVYLIVAINFQHFLRHGIDVFLGKVIFQMIFAILVAGLTGSLKVKEPQICKITNLAAK
ncbi:MAG TPA: hypothetical protein VIZ65_10825 [Cellvibrionaceae bacterium]